MIAAKLKELKDAVRKHKEDGVVGGLNHAMQGDTFPSWDVILGKDDFHDGNMLD